MHLMTYPTTVRITPALLISLLAATLAGCARPNATRQDAPHPDIVKPPPTEAPPSTPAPPPPPVTQSPAAEKPSAAATAAQTPPAEPAPARAGQKFIAYYFHRTLRCPTCLAIERNAKRSVEQGFAADLKSGRLAWRAVNIEERGNEHFEKDFELESSSLVLAEMKGDHVLRWKNLEQVWELVGNPPRFHEYVQSELRAFMGGGKAAR
jgi:hypothetical protein